jgi:hypothetical protein
MVMAKAEDDGGDRKGGSQGMRMPLLITLLVVAVIAVVYLAYYRNQVAYYTGRNLRLLSMLTAQIDGRVDMFAGFVKTFSEDNKPKDVTERPCVAEIGESLPGEVRRGIEEGTDGWRLRLQRAADPEKKLSRVCGTVPLAAILRPLFTRRVGAAFDVLLVASADGNVLYSIRPRGKQSTLLEREASDEAHSFEEQTAEETTIVVTKIDALERRSGWRGATKPLDPASLITATSHGGVTINGQDYVFFTEPYTFASGPESIDRKAQRWIVGGLVASSRFRNDVTGVSINVVLSTLAVMLLALCCWPYLRIAFIHPSQALTITDVVLIVVCTITGAAVLTLGVLDAIAYKRIVADANAQLQRFGDGINDDFGNDIERATRVLDGFVLSPNVKPDSYGIPASWATNPLVAKYPYIETLAWIDKDGMQQVKFAKEPSALVPVKDRRYFLEAMAGHTWTVKGRPYVLEWVRSTATGDVRAVLAKKYDHPLYPVIALGTELIDVTHAVAPPGVELAILDEEGDVVYHSDTQRIGYENFFAEADQNRALRSAVLARRAESFDAPYWGEDQSMYVRPIVGSPWTLVAFRAKRLTRVLNVEAVLLTLMLLLLGATPYLLLYASVLLLAPRYRAPRLWPDPNRWGDYLRLCVILVTLMLFFYLNNWALQPWSAFYGALFLPIIGYLDVYLVLHRRDAPRRFAIGGALWIAAFALLICFLVLGSTEARFIAGTLGNVVLILTALLFAAITWFVIAWRGNTQKPTTADVLRDRAALQLRPRMRYSMLYRLAGVLLLATGVAQPTIAFFRIARHVEKELLVKYAQLRAVADLEHRIDHLARTSIAPRGTSDVENDIVYSRFRSVFGSDWRLFVLHREPRVSSKERLEEPWTIPSSAAHWMPTLYDDSIAVRPLFSARSLDDLWRWRMVGESIELVRRVLFDPVVAKFVWGYSPGYQSIIVKSPLTDGALQKALEIADKENGARRTETAAREESHVRLENYIAGNKRHYIVEALVALLLLSVFWAASDFIARRVVLIDVDEPKWLARLPLSPTLGDHIFLVRRDRMLHALSSRYPMGKSLPFFDVSFAELDATNEWSAMLERLDGSEAGRNVRIVDFEYKIDDDAANEKKLQWLERLLALPDRTVIIVSRVSATFMNTTATAELVPRWRALLERFVWVTAEELQLRQELGAEPVTSLDRETAYNSFLRKLRPELAQHTDPDSLLDEIAERAETYYAGLWASCHDDEKLLLYNLAHNGLANASNRRVLRRLIARGFVRRNPNLQLFSETFRRYVLGAARRENLVRRSREQRGASTWDALRVPFFVIIVSFLLLLVTTQKDLMTTTTALATALTTGIPMVMKLIGAFTEKRLDGSERA